MIMNNQNMYYPNYYGYNNYYNNLYTNQPYTAYYHPYTQNLPNINLQSNIQNSNFCNNNVQNTFNSNHIDSDNNKQDLSLDNNKKSKNSFRLGPLDISKEKLSLFGFDIAIDDLILISLILFLFFETDCDYSILIVLGLMLFNISFSSLDLF